MAKRTIKSVLDKASATFLTERGGLPRGHLGASEIGERCPRKAWYSFRWAHVVKHGGRLLRLFDRGKREEARMVNWLRAAGFTVQEVNPDTGSQFSFKDIGGHFAGSADGKIYTPEELADVAPEGWGLVEFKTHGYKSYTDLEKRAVLTSKPIHYVQMQIYMHYMKLKWALYLAVNKNDDDLYPEIVHYKPELALEYIDRAGKIITAREAPARITQDPSWYECKFCNYREICHYDNKPDKSCRSCIFAMAIDGGGWYCEKYHAKLPEDFIPLGCDEWDPIT